MKLLRPPCCQHSRYRWAELNGVKYCICDACGHKWEEWPL